MENVDNMKEVLFSEYCPKCMHQKVEESENPCAECLSEPARQFSHKPVKFESRD